MSLLTLSNIAHLYFSKNTYTKALDQISFQVKKGEFISLLGPSGCGKSTILSIIAGLIQPTSGEVLVNEASTNTSNQLTGYMLQQDYLFPWKTVLDNILLGPQIRKQQNASMRERANQLLEEVGLPNVADLYPHSLSGGMRQRAALVRTLITEPEILLLDEPFSALDYQTKLKLEDLVFKMLRTYHKTAILVTHDIGEAISMSDRIIVMRANPGTIAKIFDVPIEIRNEIPFLVRRHQKYDLLFDKIWNELNQQEAKSAPE
ncbi:ABC transporter ATP-binding protein [Ornithinibacillus gellani]|uniref:ABC transporter ATP-binding protein n=1 Tax=Ornithinibacillus gellani TaxID=2293253 RepID=UPI000F46D678|nr:ABC transporter ATP-binding protein [Ornithinibacillus gellani]TQS75256.1 ABC transporter ATP-binding protein [Ornithinibacillus gellani]